MEGGGGVKQVPDMTDRHMRCQKTISLFTGNR